MKLKSRSAECVVCNYKRARSLFTGQVLFEHRFPLYRVFVFQARINCHCVFLSRASEKPPGLEKNLSLVAFQENAGSIVSDIAGRRRAYGGRCFYKILSFYFNSAAAR